MLVQQVKTQLDSLTHIQKMGAPPFTLIVEHRVGFLFWQYIVLVPRVNWLPTLPLFVGMGVRVHDNCERQPPRPGVP